MGCRTPRGTPWGIRACPLRRRADRAIVAQARSTRHTLRLPAAPDSPQVPRPVVAAVVLGTLLNPLNSSMIAVALVTLRHDFDVSLGTVTWLITAYYMAAVVGQPLAGRLADLLGPRRVLCAGWVLVGVTCALAPLAPSFGWLVLARVGLSLGTSAAFPAGLAVLRRSMPDGAPPPTHALAAVNVANASSAAFGPVLGGLLVGTVGWEAIFLVNVPLALVGLPLTLRFIPPDGPRVRRGDGVAPAGFGALVRNRGVLAVLVQYALVNVIFFAMFFGVPQWLEDARGLEPQEAGLLLLPLAGLGALITPLTARFVARRGWPAGFVAGAAALTIGPLLLLAVSTGSPLALVAVVVALLGVPGAFTNISLQSGLYERVPREQMGAAGGLFQTFRYLGALIATLLLAVAFGASATSAGLHAVAGVVATVGAVLLGFGARRALATGATGAARRP